MADGEVAEQEGWDEDVPAHKRSRWPLVLASVVAVYVVGLVFVGGEEALEALSNASPLALAGALLCQVVVVLLWPLVHRASLRAVGEDLPYHQALQVSMSVFSVSRTAPVGGAVGAAVGVERFTRFGIPGPAATGAAFLTGPLSLTTVVLLGAIGITLAVVTDQLGASYLGLAAAGVVLLLVVMSGILWALHTPRVGERVIDVLTRWRRLRHRSERWRRSWAHVTANAPSTLGVVRIVGWALVKWTADMSSLALVFLAFGETPQLTVVLVGFGVTQLVTTVPTTPGAVGVAEGGLVGAFVAFGIPVGLAATVAVTYRAFESWLPTVAGIPVLVRTGNHSPSR